MRKIRVLDPVISVCSVCELPLPTPEGKETRVCLHERHKGKVRTLVNGDLGVKNVPLPRFLRERAEATRKHSDRREYLGGGLYRFTKGVEMVVMYLGSHADAERRERDGWHVERDERGRPVATNPAETSVRRIRAA
jgi:hypothetical protein